MKTISNILLKKTKHEGTISRLKGVIKVHEGKAFHNASSFHHVSKNSNY
jgi:hypothetical protein